jgi:TetR/AcrR family transcriptional regulator
MSMNKQARSGAGGKSAVTRPLKSRSVKPRTAGRPPAGGTGHRDALLDAARLSFATNGFSGSSLRDIAVVAKVTPALAHYYFSDKAGLLTAVVEERVAPLVAAVAGAVVAAEPNPEAALRAFVRAYTQTGALHPWLPQLILREVLSEQGVLREQFIMRFASGMAGMLKAHVASGQAQGLFRRDLDPAAAVMSIISLCIFPFIAAPLVSVVLGVRADPERADVLAEHHLGVLLSGFKESS